MNVCPTAGQAVALKANNWGLNHCRPPHSQAIRSVNSSGWQ